MDFFIGTLMSFPYNFVPESWMACNGQLLPIQKYTALYSLLGVTYGGDGRTTFALPHLNTTGGGEPIRAVMGQGNGPGLTPRSIGTELGTGTVSLDTTQMPSHSHAFVMPPPAAGTSPAAVPPANGVLIDQAAGTFVAPGQSSATLSPLTIAPAGMGQSHDNEQPWLSLYWCICYEGVFPSRG